MKNIIDSAQLLLPLLLLTQTTLSFLTTTKTTKLHLKGSERGRCSLEMSSNKVVEEHNMRGITSFNSFLALSRRILFSSSSTKIRIVTGNEAADCDSIVSALVYAKFLSTFSPAIPVLSLSRKALNLRCETKSLLERLQVNLENIIFEDEYDISSSDHNERLEGLILMDHNALPQKQQQYLSEKVIEIVDHHVDQQLYQETVPDDKRLIAFDSESSDGGHALVGSCCTLVTEKIITQQENNNYSMTDIEATLLLGAICLDTINFLPQAHKATLRDVEAAKFLNQYTLIPQDELFEYLSNEKFSPTHWKSFTLEDCLTYDYKEFTTPTGLRYGISVVLVPLENVLEKHREDTDDNDITDVLSTFCSKQNIQFHFFLSNYLDGNESGNDSESKRTTTTTTKRQLMLYSPDQQCYENVHTKLLLLKDKLDLSSPKEITPQLIMYQQNNPQMSRKKLIPLLDGVFVPFDTTTLSNI